MEHTITERVISETVREFFTGSLPMCKCLSTNCHPGGQAGDACCIRTSHMGEIPIQAMLNSIDNKRWVQFLPNSPWSSHLSLPTEIGPKGEVIQPCWLATGEQMQATFPPLFLGLHLLAICYEECLCLRVWSVLAAVGMICTWARERRSLKVAIWISVSLTVTDFSQLN